MAAFRLSSGAGNVTVTMPDEARLLAEIDERLAARQGFALVTVNLDHMVKLRSSAAFRAAYEAHDLIVADGNPIVWLSQLAGRPVSLTPGSDLVEPLARLAVRADTPVALVGSTEETLKAAAAHLEVHAPGLDVAAIIAPSYGFDTESEEANEIFERLKASGAMLTFVALGAPRQEIFAARGRKMMPEMGFASVGAGLDFLAGRQARAPLWMRRLALEWLWRLMTDPRRMAIRYLQCSLILPILAAEALHQRSEDR